MSTGSKRLLIAALGVGLLIEAILLLLSLHTSLFLSDLVGSCNWCFWAITDLYFVLGFVIALLVVPWSSLRRRLVVASALATIAMLVGALFDLFLRNR